MNSHSRRVILGVALLAVALGTTSCGLTVSLPAVTPPPVVETETPEPTDPAEPTVASGERPDANTAATCNDLSNPAQLDPIFAVPVNLAPPTRTFEYVGSMIADEWVVRQSGGVACQWSDPNGITTSEGRYLAGMDLRLVAASASQWQEFSNTLGDGSDHRLKCDDFGYCNFDTYTDTGWWLSLTAFNIDGLASPTEATLRALTLPVFTSIEATVAALPAPDPGWTAPTPDIAFGGGCTGVTTGARIAAALGLGSAVESESLDYPSAANAAKMLIGGSDCRWARASDGWDIAYIQVLPGGAWAQQAAKAAMEANGGTVPTPAVPGVSAGATALYEHVDSWALDVVIGGSWVKISIGNGSETGGMSSPDALVAIAADIAAHAS